MRVAMFSDCYPPRLGGIERQVHDLSHRLAAAGHDVEVFTATSGPAGERGGTVTTEGRVLVHRMSLPLPGGLTVNPFAGPEVLRRLEGGRFDVAHAHLGVVSPFATDLVGTALTAGLPVATTFHCVIDRSTPAFRALGYLHRWSERGVALSAVSSMAAERVSRAARDVPVAVIGNGVDVDWWRSGPPPAPREPGDPVHVVTATRYASRKRPLALLKVLARARELLDPAVALRATVAGEGPQRRLMERYLAAHGLDWVALPGRLDREGLRALHHGADLYLTTTRLEAFGLAALEARAAGVPIVAPAGTGVDDFVTTGVEGLLGADDEALAVALARLAVDDGLRTAMHERLLAVPPAQDWSSLLEETVALYRRAGAGA